MTRDLAIGPVLERRLGELLLGVDLAAARASGGDPSAAPLVAYLAGLLGARVVGVVVYGSFARGGGEMHGDVDVLVLVEDAASGGVWGLSGEVEIDLFVYRAIDVFGQEPARWGHIADGALVFGDDDVRAWLERVRVARAGPPPLVAASKRLRDSVWARRMIGRIRRHVSTEPELAYVELATLVARMPDVFAEARGEWGGSARQWVRRLGEDAPEARAALAGMAAMVGMGGGDRGGGAARGRGRRAGMRAPRPVVQWRGAIRRDVHGGAACRANVSSAER